jgi:hypothetical protein
LEGTDRFLPCRTDENNIFTCVLEYEDGGKASEDQEVGREGGREGRRGGGRWSALYPSAVSLADSYRTSIHQSASQPSPFFPPSLPPSLPQEDRFVLINDLFYSRPDSTSAWTFKKSQFKKLEVLRKRSMVAVLDSLLVSHSLLFHPSLSHSLSFSLPRNEWAAKR